VQHLSLDVLKQLMTGQAVTHHGRFFTLDEASVGPRPAKPLDLWLGGLVPAALRRVGRLADGWLASFVTPAEAAAARTVIAEAADAAAREVEDDHYGTNLLVMPPEASEDDVDRAFATTARRRPDVCVTTLRMANWIGPKTDSPMTRYFALPVVPTVFGYDARLHGRPTVGPDEEGRMVP